MEIDSMKIKKELNALKNEVETLNANFPFHGGQGMVHLKQVTKENLDAPSSLCCTPSKQWKKSGRKSTGRRMNTTVSI